MRYFSSEICHKSCVNMQSRLPLPLDAHTINDLRLQWRRRRLEFVEMRYSQNVFRWDVKLPAEPLKFSKARTACPSNAFWHEAGENSVSKSFVRPGFCGWAIALPPTQ